MMTEFFMIWQLMGKQIEKVNNILYAYRESSFLL